MLLKEVIVQELISQLKSKLVLRLEQMIAVITGYD